MHLFDAMLLLSSGFYTLSQLYFHYAKETRKFYVPILPLYDFKGNTYFSPKFKTKYSLFEVNILTGTFDPF
jgi:hypothetical protein